jgi:hypothetical protein
VIQAIIIQRQIVKILDRQIDIEDLVRIKYTRVLLQQFQIQLYRFQVLTVVMAMMLQQPHHY